MYTASAGNILVGVIHILFQLIDIGLEVAMLLVAIVDLIVSVKKTKKK